MNLQFEKITASVETFPIHGPFGLSPGIGPALKRITPRVKYIEEPDELFGRKAVVAPVIVPQSPASQQEMNETDGEASLTSAHVLLDFDISKANLEARDLGIAASHSHLIIASSHRMTFWTKDGTLLKFLQAVDFFEEVKKDMNKLLKDPADDTKLVASTFPVNEFYDTRLVFDTYRNRFWIECLARNMASAPAEDKKHRVTATAVAVSKTENPLRGWFSYWWTTERDYQSIGISKKLLVIGYRPHLERHDTVAVVKADPLAAGTKSPPQGYTLRDLKNPDGSRAGFLEPALQHGASPANVHFLINTYFLINTAAGNTLVVWAIDPEHPTDVYRAGVPVTTYVSPKLAEQRSHTELVHPQLVHPVIAGTIVLKTVFRNGKLHACWQDSKPNDTRQVRFIRLARVDVSTFPKGIPTGPGSGLIDRRFGKNAKSDSPGVICSYYMPTLAVNADGTIVLNYCRCGLDVFPEARYSLYFSSDADIRPSHLLHRGEYPLGSEDLNWTLPTDERTITGVIDYIGIAVDPVDDRTVWMVNAFGSKKAKGQGQYKLVVRKLVPTKPS
jgi:hypothetical protein